MKKTFVIKTESYMCTQKLFLLLILSIALLLLRCAEDNPLAERDGILSIDSIAPSSGLPGTDVRIYGKGFSATPGDNIADINGVAAIVKSPASLTTLIITIPEHAATGNIILNREDQRVVGPAFTIVDPPVFTSLDPSRGFPGDQVVISGEKLLQVTAVSFNEAEAAIIARSDTELTVSAPAGTTGIVTLLYEHGIVAGPVFTFIPLPQIDSAAVVRYTRVLDALIIVCQHVDPTTDAITVYVDGEITPMLESGITAGLPYVLVDAPPRSTQNPLTLEIESNGRKSEPYEFVIKPDLFDISTRNDVYPLEVTLYGQYFGSPDDQRSVVVTVSDQPSNVTITRWTPTEINFTVPGFGTPDYPQTYRVKVVVMGLDSQTLEFLH
jgi:hypothetical protein